MAEDYCNPNRHTFFFDNDLLGTLLNNPRKFWQVVNPKKTNTIPLTNKLDEAIYNAECVNMFNVAFSPAFTDEALVSLLIYFTNMPTLMPPTMFVADGISCVIENIKLSSSAGIDEINSKQKHRANYH